MRKIIFLCHINRYCNYFPIFSSSVRKVCPECKETKCNLPLHMEVVHKWSHQSAISVVGQFSLRTRIERKSHKKNYHHKKVCPVPGCFKVSKNIGEHLRTKVHGLKSGSQEYKNLVKKAKNLEDNIDIIGSRGKKCKQTNFYSSHLFFILFRLKTI